MWQAQAERKVKVKGQRLRTELVGIEALTSYDASYGEIADTQNAHRSDYVGQPINAVVVRTWENRAPKEGGTVYLTNGEVRDPFLVFDTYDWRSVIENGIFKDRPASLASLELSPTDRGGSGRVSPLDLVGHGDHHRVSVVAKAASGCAIGPHPGSPHFAFCFIGWRRHARWRKHLERRKSRQTYRLHRARLWHFPSC